MSRKFHIVLSLLFCLWVGGQIQAQETPVTYRFKGEDLVISLNLNSSKAIQDSVLQSLGTSWDNIALMKAQKENHPSLAGWELSLYTKDRIEFSKPLKSLQGTASLKKCLLELEHITQLGYAPVHEASYGANHMDFPSVRQSGKTAIFRLKGFGEAKRVYLAGTFNNWSISSTPMKLTGKGWETEVNLEPGKHLYKYIVDGTWTLDPVNKLAEGDGSGNINNVYYQSNYTFRLNDFPDAKTVVVAGSFNDWDEKELKMHKKGNTWVLPIFLERGNHTYKFIVDGQWITDPDNPQIIPNEYGTGNSVLTLGPETLFQLNGYEEAQTVALCGDFNDWNAHLFFLERQESGWALPFVLKPGNHYYRFVVDDLPLTDPNNPHIDQQSGQPASLIAVNPNHTFFLKGFARAKQVMVSGDFNDWSESGITMERKDGKWTVDLFLPNGKTRYKFIVDGAWMEDPDNPLWEENEYGTKNSVLWME